MNRNRSFRLLLFSIGLIAVVTLTGMNVYSLFELRESTIEAAHDHKRNQIDEFTSQVRYRFFEPFRGIRKLDITWLENHFHTHHNFPEVFNDVISLASEDSIFGEIYYSPDQHDVCLNPDDPIYRFNPLTERFEPIPMVSRLVCDGMGLARSRMRVLIDDYRWNNKATFDTHRSMTLSMIDPEERRVIGHLTFLINRDYLINDYLAGQLQQLFGPAGTTGVAVWLRDFMQEEILASSDVSIPYSRDLQIDIRQRFPDLLDNWVLHAQIIDSPTVAASNASLHRNLIVLGTAVLVLFGALIFMFVTAKRERELAQRQSGFLANVTHELKTPLAAMQAAGENLADGRVADQERIRTYGDHIYRETIRLNRMIEKLLDIARLDANQAIVQPVELDSVQLFRKCYQSHADYLTELGFEVHLNLPDDLPSILVDPEHFETIMDNLIDNAKKYSPDRKRIELRASRQGNFVAFEVIDSGIGIPKKLQKRIFEKFYRAEDSLTAKTKGHGLGLSIVENLVRMNSGQITIKSQPDQGTTFTLWIPASAAGKTVPARDQLTEEPARQWGHVAESR